jgi:hypothetical protein
MGVSAHWVDKGPDLIEVALTGGAAYNIALLFELQGGQFGGAEFLV